MTMLLFHCILLGAFINDFENLVMFVAPLKYLSLNKLKAPFMWFWSKWYLFLLQTFYETLYTL